MNTAPGVREAMRGEEVGVGLPHSHSCSDWGSILFCSNGTVPQERTPTIKLDRLIDLRWFSLAGENHLGAVIGTQEYKANRRELHNHDIHHALRADLVEHVYMTHIQPPIEYCYDDLFDKSDDDFDMFVESQDSDDEGAVQENDEDYEVDDEDDDSE
ncbi:unnamed protein product [Lactuca saligna]|uniref:Uncharacterized protein n=1 Tax=Lactuca saligna TaxID=75948 RepID=A0AA35ZF28_LACSI|nr:unnamed protein product [Lactuca saligna]